MSPSHLTQADPTNANLDRIIDFLDGFWLLASALVQSFLSCSPPPRRTANSLEPLHDRQNRTITPPRPGLITSASAARAPGQDLSHDGSADVKGPSIVDPGLRPHWTERASVGPRACPDLRNSISLYPPLRMRIAVCGLRMTVLRSLRLLAGSFKIDLQRLRMSLDEPTTPTHLVTWLPPVTLCEMRAARRGSHCIPACGIQVSSCKLLLAGAGAGAGTMRLCDRESAVNLDTFPRSAVLTRPADCQPMHMHMHTQRTVTIVLEPLLHTFHRQTNDEQRAIRWTSSLPLLQDARYFVTSRVSSETAADMGTLQPSSLGAPHP